jgi:hypothetical protein
MILGLARTSDTMKRLIDFRNEGEGEVWTLNDYFNYYPVSFADLIFNLHSPEMLEVIDKEGAKNYNYKDHYNESKAGVVTLQPIAGLRNQSTFQVDEQAEPYWYACSICCMLYYAMLKKHNVVIEGIRLGVGYDGTVDTEGGEYDYEVAPVVQCIEAIRANATVTVDDDLWKAWKLKADYNAMVGETPAFVPYWMRYDKLGNVIT